MRNDRKGPPALNFLLLGHWNPIGVRRFGVSRKTAPRRVPFTIFIGRPRSDGLRRIFRSSFAGNCRVFSFYFCGRSLFGEGSGDIVDSDGFSG